MPFTPPPSSPIPLLDASLYDALGDLTPKAQLLAEARLTISFAAGKVVVEVAGAAVALARLTFTPEEFHEALRTIAMTQRHTGGHVLSAADQTFWLDEMRGDGVLVRLAALWPPRAHDVEPPLTLVAHGCSEHGSLALVVHLTPDAARQLVHDGAHFLADLAETAGQIQAASGLSLAGLLPADTRR